jgi:hypothetical protein
MAKTKTSHKKSNSKKFAIIGLVVSGIALLATILLLVVKLLTVAKIYTIPNVQGFNWALGISSALIVLGLGVTLPLCCWRLSVSFS